MAIILMLIVISCSNNEQVLPNLDEERISPTAQLDADPLIVNLKSLNDSLISNRNIESRGFRDFFRFMDAIAVVVADVRGAIDGAKWGGSLLGWPGAILGSVVVGATYSTLAGLCCDSRALSENKVNLQQVELAYVNATLDEGLIRDEILEATPIAINIPKEYQSSLEVGVLHNATLRIIDEDIPMQYELEDGLSTDEIKMLNSDEFVSKYNYSLENPQVLTLEYINDDPSKEDRVIQLFLQAYQEYPSDLDDVNYLINRYIELIEIDPQITEMQKEIVYSALSTAAYSTNYWYNKASNQ